MQRVFRTCNDFFLHGYPLCISFPASTFGAFIMLGYRIFGLGALKQGTLLLEDNSDFEPREC